VISSFVIINYEIIVNVSAAHCQGISECLESGHPVIGLNR